MPHPPPSIPTWDLPTRMFHWILVLLVLDALISHTFGGIRMLWHFWNGYAILTLLVFRFIWGFVGSSTARFGSFLAGWTAIRHYLGALRQGETPHHLGHNPIGGWSVMAMLALLAVQGTSGLFATDEIVASGPLHGLVDADTADRLTTLHSLWFWLLVGMMALHVGAVFFHLIIKKDNLILPMLTGHKRPDQAPPDASARMQSPWLALPVLGVSILLVWFGIQVWRW
ncbi:MAG: cytochrome b/b6 domain-containing protein [Magnetococcales bacterium]|nr:cytochrome b/b6 domain-containing protein [Magnetococcales bacterium]